jgi:VIT1/CCC1 family predicted Fe2+/Mn2+ transporter
VPNSKEKIMDNLDKLISETLDSEEREILEKIGREPSFPQQAIGLFRGRLGWLNGTILIWHLAFAFAGIFAAWKFFTMSEVLESLRWGLSAAVLLLAALITRLTLLRSMQTNRVLQAVKRLETQIALLVSTR